MLYAVANATVPKVTVVLRKAYGAGYYVMNGRAYEPDLIVAWPSAEISVMGAEGAVEIVFRKQVEEAEDPAAKKAELIEAYRKIIDVYIAARNDMVDDVIDPRETRPTIIRALEMAEGKRVERPWKRHGVVPVWTGRSPSRIRSSERLVAPQQHAVDPEQDHHADDGADEAAEVEHGVVADAEHLGEDEEADDRAGEAEQDGGEEPHRVLAGHQQAADEAGDDAEDDGADQR